MFVIFALLARIVATDNIPLVARIPLMIICLLGAQQGLHLLGFVAHDGFHFSLYPNKYVSVFASIFFSSMIVGWPAIGYALVHPTHHRYTNQSQDPDRQIYVKYKSVWQRMFLARLAINRQNVRHTFDVLLGRSLPDYYARLPFNQQMIRVFAVVNILTLIFWLSIYIAITIFDPLTGIIGILLPHLLSIGISGFRFYVEHAETGIGPFCNSRTRTSWLMSILYFFNNYHLEHHLYPSVPCYKLPMVHRLLKEQGIYEQASSPIEKGLFSDFSFMMAKLTDAP
ncbi:fatty acid desaturase family protein [Gloeothece verrucosa]|nr:fatty acid desaturase [Gloeothece verrucosa]